MIKVLIADDHTMFVDGIESILKLEEGVNVVGRCYDGASVLTFVQKQPTDIVLLDVNLPIIIPNGVITMIQFYYLFIKKEKRDGE